MNISPRATFQAPLVLVHLGGKVPLYLRANLRYLKKLKFPLVLITDTRKIERKYKSHRLDTFLYEESDAAFRKLSELLDHNEKFREGFWLKAIIRFMALQKYMQETGVQRLIHLESDVWISPNFPIGALSKAQSISFPLCNEHLGIPSVFIVPSLDMLNEFNLFCINQMQSDSQATDMKLLAEFAKKFPKKVSLLPTFSGTLLRQEFLESVPKSKDYLQVETGKIFDANSLGQYFFGWDPRNEKGYRKLFQNYREHFVDPRHSRLKFDGSKLFICKEGFETEVFNLHVHSKDIRVFFKPALKYLVALRNLQERRGLRTQPTFQIINRNLTSLKGSIKRNLHLS